MTSQIDPYYAKKMAPIIQGLVLSMIIGDKEMAKKFFDLAYGGSKEKQDK